ncbi:MAG: hypothetical protein ACTHUU_10345 [Brachybacterium sp.]
MIIMVAVVALGVLLVITAGSQVIDGDLTSTPDTGRARWVSPPIALVIGLGLALSPIGIIWQERRFAPDPDQWSLVLMLTAKQVFVEQGPSRGRYLWDEATDDVLAGIPPSGRPVIEHYLDHPEDRHELGSRAAQRRAMRLSRSDGG